MTPPADPDLALREVVPVLAAWGIDDVTDVAVPSLGTMNETWIVDHGAGRSVLRRHRTANPDDVAFEHLVIDHARGAGIPTPRLLATPAGERIVELDGRLHTLYSHEPGVHAPRGRAGTRRAYAAGIALAEIHDALAGMTGGRAGMEALPRLAVMLPLLERLEAAVRASGDPSLAWVLTDLDDRRAWLADHEDAPAGCGDDLQVIHGDYQLTNVLYVGDVVSSVIDWDKARVASPAMEVVRTLDHGLELAAADCSAFLDGYRRVRSFPDELLDAAVDYWTHQQARSLWVLERIVLDPHDRVAVLAAPFRPFAERWRETLAAA